MEAYRQYLIIILVEEKKNNEQNWIFELYSRVFTKNEKNNFQNIKKEFFYLRNAKQSNTIVILYFSIYWGYWKQKEKMNEKEKGKKFLEKLLFVHHLPLKVGFLIFFKKVYV